MNLYQRLISYLTQYDMRESKKPGYNPYALTQYFQAAQPLELLAHDPDAFAYLLALLFSPGFKPREVLLKACSKNTTGPVNLYTRKP